MSAALRLVMAALDSDDFVYRHILQHVKDGGDERIDDVIKNLCALAIGAMVAMNSGGQIDQFLGLWMARQLDADELHEGDDKDA